VGNKAFCTAYHSKLGDRTYRVVDEEDIVPRVPGLLAGYRHVGTEEFISGFPTGIKENPTLWMKLISDAYDLWRARMGGQIALRLLLTDHHIENYLRRLA